MFKIRTNFLRKTVKRTEIALYLNTNDRKWKSTDNWKYDNLTFFSESEWSCHIDIPKTNKKKSLIIHEFFVSDDSPLNSPTNAFIRQHSLMQDLLEEIMSIENQSAKVIFNNKTQFNITLGTKYFKRICWWSYRLWSRRWVRSFRPKK